MKEEVSKQRLAQIRCYILRDIIGWTLREPHRIVWLKVLWGTFHWLVYKREQKFVGDSKHCPGCEKLGRECWHPIADFYKNEKLKEGLSTYCKRCTNKKSMEYAREHKGNATEQARRYRRKNVEKFREYQREYYRKNRAKRLEAIKRSKQKKANRQDGK